MLSYVMTLSSSRDTARQCYVDGNGVARCEKALRNKVGGKALAVTYLRLNNIFVARNNDTHRRGILACCLLEFFLNGFH